MNIPSDIENRPEEWDFRTVREDQLKEFILYEYARSLPLARSIFDDWHKKVIGPAGETALMALQRLAEFQPTGSEVLRIVRSMPEEFDHRPRLLEVFLVHHLFPEPLLRVASSVIGRPKNLPGIVEIPSLLRRHPINPDTKKAVLVIDLTTAASTLRAGFEDWLRRKRPFMKSVPRARGKSSHVPWVALKELAAYRLSEGGMMCKNVREFIREYASENFIQDAPDVLPDYSAAGYSEAVNKAKERLRYFLRGAVPKQEADI